MTAKDRNVNGKNYSAMVCVASGAGRGHDSNKGAGACLGVLDETYRGVSFRNFRYGYYRE